MVDAGNACKNQENGASLYKALKATVEQVDEERVVKNLWKDEFGTGVSLKNNAKLFIHAYFNKLVSLK